LSARAPVRAVLLDAAGTLLRPRERVGETYSRLARRHGVAVSAERLEEAFRRVLRAAPAMAFPDAPPEAVPALERAWWRERVRATFRAADQMAVFADFESFFAELFEHYARPAAWEAAPGAAEALARLSARGLRLAVLSDFDLRLPRLLEGLGLARHLEAVVLPAATRVAKPSAGAFRSALERLDVAASEAAYVGDDPERDLAAARAAGLRAVDVRALATLAELPDAIAALEDPP
jgi:putative hydrolase of the HAD superfamily